MTGKFEERVKQDEIEFKATECFCLPSAAQHASDRLHLLFHQVLSTTWGFSVFKLHGIFHQARFALAVLLGPHLSRSN